MSLAADIHLVLSKFEGVKQTAPNKWLAKCSAHSEKHASLGFKLTEEDSIIMHCFAGCDTSAVLAAVDLEFSDIFPQKTACIYDSTKPRPKAPRFSKSELFDLLVIEALILAMVFEAIRNHGSVSAADVERAQKAFDCVMRLHCEVYS
jgi:hypothetical protein